MKAAAVSERLSALDWAAITASLDARGFATTGALLTADECVALAARYAERETFRGRVAMARHGFGQGEYKYFAYPLPEPIASLREALYPPLASVANRWHERLGIETRFPATLAAMLDRCLAAGQSRPTPLLLKYGSTDYNCLHQDLYGEHVFPIQATVLLSAPGKAFEGGEFTIVEQRPRRQSRAHVVPLALGEAVLFAVNIRPMQSARGFARAVLRHGVSEVRAGERYTAGIIFHDAR
jgi:uncharacterized protein